MILGFFTRKHLLILLAVFFLSLIPRIYGSQTAGWNWFNYGSFTLVNYDEANSCRAWLGDFKYSPLTGAKSVFVATLMGNPPPDSAKHSDREVKKYCVGAEHITAARFVSTIAGSLTVLLVGLISLTLWPERPLVAWASSAILALSGFHSSLSHSGTADSAMTFYIYLHILAVIVAIKMNRKMMLGTSLVVAVPAVLVKRIWPMSFFAYLAILSAEQWRKMFGRLNAKDFGVLGAGLSVSLMLAFNTEFRALGVNYVFFGFYLLVPWRRLPKLLWPLFVLFPMLIYVVTEWSIPYMGRFTFGELEGLFGTGFGAIGWHKIPRNIINVPVAVMVGLGIPASILLPLGLWRLLRSDIDFRLLVCFLPVLVYLVYLLFVAPRTMYRHYLPLIPLAALLAAYGLSHIRESFRVAVLFIVLSWQALLLIDLEMDYFHDPRRKIVAWYAQHPDDSIYASYYTSPPLHTNSKIKLFKPELYLEQEESLRRGRYLVLNESWYDTAYRNELNGPFVSDLDRLVNTKPEYAIFHRQVLSGENPHFERILEIPVRNFMPELVLHKKYYGTFQKFVGDMSVYEIKLQER